MQKSIALIMFLMFAAKVPAQSRNERISRIVKNTVNNKNVFGVSLSVSKGDSLLSVSAGNLSDTSSYFIASTTKLYVAAVIFHMEETGKLRLDDPIGNYLDLSTLNGLHRLKGVDHGSKITIRQLLSHTSGLPDYFRQKDDHGHTLFDVLVKRTDTFWTFDDAVSIAKNMKPRFAPGTPNRAFYSDLNYQLLGKIIENSYKQDIDKVFRTEIYDKLGLTRTYVYHDATDTTPANMYYKDHALIIPKAMTSFRADGGIVTTTAESLRFIRAFFGGELFSRSYVTMHQEWRKIFAPLLYGTGMMKFELPAFYTGFRKVPFLVGHSGHSGAFQWYCPETDTYYAGTVNQVGKPSISYKLMVKLLMVK